MMLTGVLIGGWLVLGIAGVVIGVWLAPEDDPPYRDSWEEESNAFLLTVATMLGPFGLIGTLLKWFSRAAATAKKEKRRVAEKMERDPAKARAEVDEPLKTKREA